MGYVGLMQPANAKKTVRVFISSTFRDMHAERDFLNRFVFPELRHRCSQAGLEFVAVDLRWGVTEEETQGETALRICLEEIEHCRPFFVCLLGDRYGWVPPPAEIPRDIYESSCVENRIGHDELLRLNACYALDETSDPPCYRLRRNLRLGPETEKWLIEFWCARGLAHCGESITAREILRGVFEEGFPPSHGFFYLRRPGLHHHPHFPPSFIPVFCEQNKATQARMEELKTEIHRHAQRFVVRDYDAEYTGLTIDPSLLPADLSQAERASMADGTIQPEEWPSLTDKVQKIILEHGTVVLAGMEALGRQILDDLWLSIEKETELAPAGSTPDRHEEDRANHEWFLTSRTRLFLGHEPLLDKMLGYALDAAGTANVRQRNTPLVVTGESGCGKSSLLAEFVSRCRTQSPQALVVPHFIGVSPGSTNLPNTLASICETLRRACSLQRLVPTNPEAIISQFDSFLTEAAAVVPVILVIDALDQLDNRDYSHELSWLPEVLPKGVRMVVSTVSGICLERLEKRVEPDCILEMTSLSMDDLKEIARLYLARRRKKLTEPQMNLLLDPSARPDAALPLYLVVALEELCLYGDHETLTHRIESLPATVTALFSQVLARLEHDYGAELTRFICSLLAIARSGLHDVELIAMLNRRFGKPALVRWSYFKRGIEDYLQAFGEHTDAPFSFFHRQLTQAVQHLYLDTTTSAAASHQVLADYFLSRVDPAEDATWLGTDRRAWSELVFHLVMARDYPTLRQLIHHKYPLKESEFLDEASALRDAQDIAECFSLAGEPYWNDLQASASAYCDLSEQSFMIYLQFPKLIEQGELPRLMTLVRSEMDPEARRLLTLAVATLLEEKGHSELAQQLKKEIPTQQPSHLHQYWRDCISYRRQHPCEPINWPPSGESTASLAKELDAAYPDVRPASAFRVIDFVIHWFSKSGWHDLAISLAVASTILLCWLYYDCLRPESLQQARIYKLTGMRYDPMDVILLFMFFLMPIASFACTRAFYAVAVNLRKDHSIVALLKAASEKTNDQALIVERIAGWYVSLAQKRPNKDSRLGAPAHLSKNLTRQLACSIIADFIRDMPDAKCAARLIAVASKCCYDDPLSIQLQCALRDCKPQWRKTVYKELLKISTAIVSPANLPAILRSHMDDMDLDLLAFLVEEAARSLAEAKSRIPPETKPVERSRIEEQLRDSDANLAILASAGVTQLCSSILINVVGNKKKQYSAEKTANGAVGRVLQRILSREFHRAVIAELGLKRVPLSPRENSFWFAFWVVLAFFLSPILALLVFVCIGVVILAPPLMWWVGTVHFAETFPRIDKQAALQNRTWPVYFLHTLCRFPGGYRKFYFEGWDFRRVTREVLYQIVCRDWRAARTAFLDVDLSTITHTLRRVTALGTYTDRAHSLLGVMGNRALFEPFARGCAAQTHACGVERSQEEQFEQLVRCSPKPLSRTEFILILFVAWACLLLLGAVAVLPFHDIPVPNGPIFCGCLCTGFLVFLLLMRRQRFCEGERSGFLSFSLWSFILSVFGVAVFAVWVQVSSTTENSRIQDLLPGFHAMFAGVSADAACYVIAALLIPDFIARWHGSNLFFPTRAQIIRQRVMACLFLPVICILLGMACAGVASFFA